MKSNKLIRILKICLVIPLLLFITGCPFDKNDNIYPVTEEVYLMGWRLHNIDDSTPTTLSYNQNELSTYNYSYRFPGDSPYKYSSRGFNSETFWTGPYDFISSATHVNFNAPQNRVFYVKGDKAPQEIYGRDWELQNSIYIQYITTTGDRSDQLLLDLEYKEDLISINPPGEKCTSPSQCSSDYCHPGPEGNDYCTLRSKNCAKPGTDGVMFGDSYIYNNILYECKAGIGLVKSSKTSGFWNGVACVSDSQCGYGVCKEVPIAGHYCKDNSMDCPQPATGGVRLGTSYTYNGIDYECKSGVGLVLGNGFECTLNSQCNSTYCYPGPKGKEYCTHRDKNCAKPGTDGVIFEETYTHNGFDYECKLDVGLVEKNHIYFGYSYLPTSVIVKNGLIKLNNHLLRGFNGKSYLQRRIFQCKNCTQPLPIPSYKVLIDKKVISEGDILDKSGDWDYKVLNHPISKPGNYDVITEIPSGYPLYKKTKITTTFSYSNQKTLNLPILKQIKFPPRFNINNNIPIELKFENQDQITEIKKYYKTSDTGSWIPISENSITITDSNAKFIDFMFSASTSQGKATYEISSISLKGVGVTCSQIHYYEDSDTIVSGKCTSEVKLIQGLRLKVFSNDELLGAVSTDPTGDFSLVSPGEKQNINVRFEGSGIYNPDRWGYNPPPEPCDDPDNVRSVSETGEITCKDGTIDPDVATSKSLASSGYSCNRGTYDWRCLGIEPDVGACVGTVPLDGTDTNNCICKITFNYEGRSFSTSTQCACGANAKGVPTDYCQWSTGTDPVDKPKKECETDSDCPYDKPTCSSGTCTGCKTSDCSSGNQDGMSYCCEKGEGLGTHYPKYDDKNFECWSQCGIIGS